MVRLRMHRPTCQMQAFSLVLMVVDHPFISNMDYFQWSNESYLIATQIVYHDIQPEETPSSEYLAIGQRTALRQIALAGYRLAGLIGQIFNQ